MNYSAGKAAIEVGKTKSTITKAIASGKLSAIKNASGAWEIDAAELFRVYPPTPHNTVEIERSETPKETTLKDREIHSLERLLDAAEAQIEDLKTDRDEWRKQATNLLTNSQPSRKKFLGIF